AAGLIDGPTGARIRAFEKSSRAPIALYALGVLGAGTVALGIISLIAANWDAIPATMKLAGDLLIGPGARDGDVRGRAAWRRLARRSAHHALVRVHAGVDRPRGSGLSAHQPDVSGAARVVRRDLAAGAARAERGPRGRRHRARPRGDDLAADRCPGTGPRRQSRSVGGDPVRFTFALRRARARPVARAQSSRALADGDGAGLGRGARRRRRAPARLVCEDRPRSHPRLVPRGDCGDCGSPSPSRSRGSIPTWMRDPPAPSPPSPP